MKAPGPRPPSAGLFPEPGKIFALAEGLQAGRQSCIPGKSTRQAGRQFAAEAHSQGALLRRQKAQQMQERGGFRRMPPPQPGRDRGTFRRLQGQIAGAFRQPGRKTVFQAVSLNLTMIVRLQQARFQAAALQQAVPQATGFPGVESVAQYGPGGGFRGKAATRGSQAQAEIRTGQAFQARPEPAHSQKILPPHEQSRVMGQLKNAPPCGQRMGGGQAFIEIVHLPLAVGHAAQMADPARAALPRAAPRREQQGVEPGQTGIRRQPLQQGP